MKRLTPTQLFLDGGDPGETAEGTRLLNDAGYVGLDGQTTNPSLVAKNPDIAARIARGDLLSREELLSKYKEIVQDIERSASGAISIEVYADHSTSARDMVAQAREMGSWISSAVIKLPTTEQGLRAAQELKGDFHLNMTLCFSQQQAAAVYAATRDAAYPVFVSPFIGRLDDRGENGMQLIANLMRMFAESDHHVEVLTASVRHVDHVLGALQLGTDALTLPFAKAFQPWAEQGFLLPDAEYTYRFSGRDIPYVDLDLDASWQSFAIAHELTDVGLQTFADDWNGLLVSG